MASEEDHQQDGELPEGGSSSGSEAKLLQRQALSSLANVRFSIRAFYHHRVATFLTSIDRMSRASSWKAIAPKIVKTYPARPDLPVRIFLPKSGTDDEKVPLYILLHGGGWIIGDAQMDDEQAYLLANKYSFCVVSLDYHLAPRHQFPVAIHDCAALIKDILADQSLPVDLRRVVLGGFSVGASMALGLVQLPEISPLIKGIVAFYPLTDCAGGMRPKGELTAWGKPSNVENNLPLYDWAYIPVGHNLCDPLLSPIYATRVQISHPVFIVTGGADVLRVEACALAKRLAGLPDDAGSLKPEESWEEGDIKYTCVRDMPHYFTHHAERINDTSWETKRVKGNEDIWKEVHDWSTKFVI